MRAGWAWGKEASRLGPDSVQKQAAGAAMEGKNQTVRSHRKTRARSGNSSKSLSSHRKVLGYLWQERAKKAIGAADNFGTFFSGYFGSRRPALDALKAYASLDLLAT